VATTEQPANTEPASHLGDFGANEWLVEDMYERYQADPSSVDEAWHDFFKDYRPPTADAGNGKAAEKPRPAATPAEKPTPPSDERSREEAPPSTPTAAAKPTESKPDEPSGTRSTQLRGAAARVVQNME